MQLVLTNEAMGLLISLQLVPHHVQVLPCEVDCEPHSEVIQVDLHRRVVERLDHRAFRDEEFPVAERDHIDVLSLEGDFIIDVNAVDLGIKLYLGRV